MALMLRRDDLDTGTLIKWLVAGFFFLIPLLKAWIDARKKQAEEAQKGTGRRARKTEEEAQGKTRWEELMRGEAPAPPAPPPRAARPKPRPAPDAALEEAPPPPLVVLDEGGLAPLSAEEDLEVELPPDEARVAEEMVSTRDRDELRRQREVARLEREAASPHRRSVEPLPVAVFEEAQSSAASSTPRSPARELVASGLAGDRRAALRRSLLMAEILGTPLSMRSPQDAWRPSGLRV